MPTFIATYDLRETNPDPHSTFLAQARKHGWNYFIKAGNGHWYRLPNTTLEGTFPDRGSAVAALENTRAATAREIGRPVTMPKWIVAEYSSAQFNSDDIRDR